MIDNTHYLNIIITSEYILINRKRITWCGMIKYIEGLDVNIQILISLCFILLAGFGMTRLTNLVKLPKVSGFIIAGIVIGPHVLGLVPKNMIDGMSFISDIALAFIAFGIGKYFKFSVLKSGGIKVIILTLLESLPAGVITAVVLKYIFSLDWSFAVLLGSIAAATAPASTMMTIKQYKAKGDFVNTLLQVVALDNVICLFAFSVVLAICGALNDGGIDTMDVVLPVVYNIGGILLGALCGWILDIIITPSRSDDSRLILMVAFLLGLSGFCAVVDISPLLSCMVFGMVYINLTKDKHLFRQADKFTPPFMELFFIISGMNLDISALKSVGLIGITYFAIRLLLKYGGAFLGGVVTKSEKVVRNYLGLALIPQAGVAIGLAFLGSRALPKELGDTLLTIILSSSVLYELIGPACAKYAIFRSGDIKKKKKKEHKDTEPTAN